MSFFFLSLSMNLPKTVHKKYKGTQIKASQKGNTKDSEEPALKQNSAKDVAQR